MISIGTGLLETITMLTRRGSGGSRIGRVKWKRRVAIVACRDRHNDTPGCFRCRQASRRPKPWRSAARLARHQRRAESGRICARGGDCVWCCRWLMILRCRSSRWTNDGMDRMWGVVMVMVKHKDKEEEEKEEEEEDKEKEKEEEEEEEEDECFLCSRTSGHCRWSGSGYLHPHPRLPLRR